MGVESNEQNTEAAEAATEAAESAADASADVAEGWITSRFVTAPKQPLLQSPIKLSISAFERFDWRAT